MVSSRTNLISACHTELDSVSIDIGVDSVS